MPQMDNRIWQKGETASSQWQRLRLLASPPGRPIAHHTLNLNKKTVSRLYGSSSAVR